MSYLSEKFNVARSFLMLPHPNGESQSIADAFHECHLAMTGYNGEGLSPDDQADFEKLRELMNTDFVPENPEKGKWFAKAETFTLDQKFEVSRVIDALANAFSRES